MFKISAKNVEKYCNTWKENLASNTQCIKNVDIPLFELCKKPKEKFVIGRFNSLGKEIKCKKRRTQIIVSELSVLWKKLNFKTLSLRSIKRNVERLIKSYQNFLKRRNKYSFNKIFDITSNNEEQQSDESEHFPISISKTDNVPLDDDYKVPTIMDDDQVSSDDDITYKPPASLLQKKKPMKPAVNLVMNANVSTRKAAKICKELSESGVEILSPSQPGIYKAYTKNAEQKKKLLKNTLKNENWCLHFDGKKIGKKEYQVVVLKNASREVKLGVLVLNDGKASTIFHGIKELCNFDLLESIKMIICDTTSVNTGRHHGVVTRLQNFLKSFSLPAPQYIGCQHHVLDLMLKHVMDELLEGKTSSPNISYNFIPNLIENYDDLKKEYEQNKECIKVKSIKWRNDMQYLYELVEAFKYFEKNERFPYIKFKAIPPLSNARWNSRAILALLAFILIPEYRLQLYPICKFVCGAWSEIWFSDHTFNKNNFATLQKSLAGFTKANECFLRHWVNKPSAIEEVQRSNICAERAIKIVQDILPLCKSSHTLNLKLISYNN